MENLSFPVDFPLNQSIHTKNPLPIWVLNCASLTEIEENFRRSSQKTQKYCGIAKSCADHQKIYRNELLIFCSCGLWTQMQMVDWSSVDSRKAWYPDDWWVGWAPAPPARRLNGMYCKIELGMKIIQSATKWHIPLTMLDMLGLATCRSIYLSNQI